MNDILRQSGCLDFIGETARHALDELEHARPACFALLTEQARNGLRTNCAKRLEPLYTQALTQKLKERASERDPACMMASGANPALETMIAEEMAQDAGGRMGAFLRERFPLAADYEAQILRNFHASWIEFFDALTACREEISGRLLKGRPFTRIEGFSDFGGDQHRHGRAVIGVWTNGGVFYYKPHDCGLDAAYHEIVGRWFSDCTAAARVVQSKGVSFVSCLSQAPVKKEEGISDYYYNFGVLTALLHGLGSTDMHFENIMACGDRPAVVDTETLISPFCGNRAGIDQLMPGARALRQSVCRIGILPFRIYGSPMLSPLYSRHEGSACLPGYGGRTYTAEGYEDRFLVGFRDGYARMLAHREEIRELLRTCSGAAVRCMLQNTMFYALIRRSLYRPEALQSQEEQKRILHRLSLPFTQESSEVFREEVEHEAACLKMGDIPYFCTALDGTDLCGDDPKQILKAGYYSESPLDMTGKSLDRLSAAELRYEEDVIRVAFAHAPLDAQEESAPQPLEGSSTEYENARRMAVSLFRALKDDVILLPEGGRAWLSTVITLHGISPCGIMGAFAEAGAFCAEILRTYALSEFHAEAMELARDCVSGIAKELAELSKSDRETLISSARLPMGLYNGCGGVLWGLAAMEKANVPFSGETSGTLLRFLMRQSEFWHADPTVAYGLSGLMPGLDMLNVNISERNECARACAERLLEADVPSIPDAQKGAAGIAAALAAAYRLLGDMRCVEKALAILKDVRDAYDDALRGWPDSGVKIRWMAGRGPQAAGISLAAGYTAKRLPEPGAAEELRETALISLLDEKELGRFDTLDQGNALAALCLLRTGRIKRAGQVLEAIRQRAGREGSYTVTAPGIRSFFDPALWLGSLGVGWAAMEYLRLLTIQRPASP